MIKKLYMFILLCSLYTGCVRYVYLTPEDEQSAVNALEECHKRNIELQAQLQEAIRNIENLKECP